MANTKWPSLAEIAYAKASGWKAAHRDAGLHEIAAGTRNLPKLEYPSEQLGEMYDHATVYDFASTRRPAAIVVHTYRGPFSQAAVDAIASRYGVTGKIIEATL